MPTCAGGVCGWAVIRYSPGFDISDICLPGVYLESRDLIKDRSVVDKNFLELNTAGASKLSTPLKWAS
jgi:hypothetical protein